MRQTQFPKKYASHPFGIPENEPSENLAIVSD
jgi:hypothetical protein